MTKRKRMSLLERAYAYAYRAYPAPHDIRLRFSHAHAWLRGWRAAKRERRR